jgi:ribosomal protein S18 acetylase RimI-like enzyme
MIRQATLKDMPIVADIHKKIFSNHFIGILPKFLICKFYRSYVKKDNVFLVSADENHIISGFVLGGYSSVLDKCRSHFIKRNILCLVLSIIFSPKIYPLVFNRLKNHKEFKSAIPFSLLSIGICEEQKGKGIAQQLILRFDKIMKTRNIDKYGLSVYKSNERAIRFYKKCGFLYEGESDRLFHYYKVINLSR